MSKLATTLKDEFTRLGRKEANRATARLKSRLAALEKIVRAQRMTLQTLGRQMAAVVDRSDRSTKGIATPAPAGDASRLSPRLIRLLRTRLKLTQTAFAQLTGVTHVAVYLWESGKTNPRGASREAILSLRGLGVREVRKRLEAAGESKRGRPARKGKKTAPKRVARRRRS